MDALETWVLLRGLRAGGMEQRWTARAVLDDGADTGTLHVRRSWTGNLIYDVRFAIDRAVGGARLTGAEVNLDREQRGYGTRAGEHAACLGLLTMLLFPWRRAGWQADWRAADGASEERSEAEIDADWAGKAG